MRWYFFFFVKVGSKSSSQCAINFSLFSSYFSSDLNLAKCALCSALNSISSLSFFIFLSFFRSFIFLLLHSYFFFFIFLLTHSNSLQFDDIFVLKPGQNLNLAQRALAEGVMFKGRHSLDRHAVSVESIKCRDHHAVCSWGIVNVWV